MLVTAINQKVNYILHTATLLFYIQEAKIEKVFIFLKDLSPYTISGPFLKWHYYHSLLNSYCVGLNDSKKLKSYILIPHQLVQKLLGGGGRRQTQRHVIKINH
jgi:hypothetical protein